jgi:gamma-glutamylcyclotransferase (GGCT)/AIG2-like uncharacterized protein YtfP
MDFTEYTDKELIMLGTRNGLEGTLAHELASRFRDWLDDWKEMDDTKYREDSTLRVAVYGSLRKGFHNHKLLKGYKFLGVAEVAGFDMYDLGSFPAATYGTGKITVEVYEIGARALKALDHLEGFPSFYDRAVTETPFGDAIIYMMPSLPRQYSSRKVKSGNWAARTAPNSDYFLMDSAMENYYDDNGKRLPV